MNDQKWTVGRIQELRGDNSAFRQPLIQQVKLPVIADLKAENERLKAEVERLQSENDTLVTERGQAIRDHQHALNLWAESDAALSGSEEALAHVQRESAALREENTRMHDRIDADFERLAILRVALAFEAQNCPQSEMSRRLLTALAQSGKGMEAQIAERDAALRIINAAIAHDIAAEARINLCASVQPAQRFHGFYRDAKELYAAEQAAADALTEAVREYRKIREVEP